MSYDAETAARPLTGEPFDEIILSEREQQHMIRLEDGEWYHMMPCDEYCELRDAYINQVCKKPLTLDEVEEQKAVWLEYRFLREPEPVLFVYSDRSEVCLDFGLHNLRRRLRRSQYDRQWRCWATKPTADDMGNTRWEERDEGM